MKALEATDEGCACARLCARPRLCAPGDKSWYYRVVISTQLRSGTKTPKFRLSEKGSFFFWKLYDEAVQKINRVPGIQWELTILSPNKAFFDTVGASADHFRRCSS